MSTSALRTQTKGACHTGMSTWKINNELNLGLSSGSATPLQHYLDQVISSIWASVFYLLNKKVGLGHV